jgi:FlaA1/EpsC-like NDP-sugar epimerase
VLVNDWFLALAAAGGLRVAVRAINDISAEGANRPSRRQRVLVVGAGAAGIMVVKELRRNQQLGMQPIAFLDDDVGKVGKVLLGLPVVGTTDQARDVVRARQLNHVIIAMPTAPGAAVRPILEQCRDAGITFQIVPGVFELLGGKATINRLRAVEISDLLRRAPIQGTEAARLAVADRVVLITGAGGSIGFELARQAAGYVPAHLVLMGHGENSLFEAEARLRTAFPGLRVTTEIADIRDSERLGQVFDRTQPAVVFHAAAHKHVPLMELNSEEAVTNNIIGTRNVIDHAVRVGVERFVLISTDKAVAPSSVMGATKRIAEALVRAAARRHKRAFVVVRFGNVLGSRGSVVNTFKTQIQQGGPITVTHPEMTRYFMTIPEAVHLVLQAGGEGKGGELFVLNMGNPVKIVDLAQDLIRLSGLEDQEVPIEFTGLRPGEKLHERLFDVNAQTLPTSHPDVWRVVEESAVSEEEMAEAVVLLEAAARQGDQKAIRQLLSRVAPGFALQSDSAYVIGQ